MNVVQQKDGMYVATQYFPKVLYSTNNIPVMELPYNFSIPLCALTKLKEKNQELPTNSITSGNRVVLSIFRSPPKQTYETRPNEPTQGFFP